MEGCAKLLHGVNLGGLPNEVLFVILDMLDLQSCCNVAQVSKFFCYFIKADNFLWKKFVQKELWYICAPEEERKQYGEYRSALADVIRLDFDVGSRSRLSLSLHPKMSVATLHRILCAMAYYPPFKTSLSLEPIGYSEEEAEKRQTSSRVFNVSLSEIEFFTPKNCIRVAPVAEDMLLR